LTSWNVRR